MVEALLDKEAQWLSGEGPESSVVVASECTLLRNLADSPFPGHCTEGELAAIEGRVVGVLDVVHMLDEGRYCSLTTIDQDEEARFLAERRLLAFFRSEMIVPRGHGQVGVQAGPSRSAVGATPISGPRGVYAADDQSLGIMVNGSDHLCGRALASGLQLRDVWARLNLVDDTLAGMLDFAYEDRCGYLTRDLCHAGTGLKARVILHLPALAMANEVNAVAELAKGQNQVLRGVRPTVALRLWPKGSKEEVMGQGDAKAPAIVGVLSEGLYSDVSGSLCGAVDEAEGDLYVLSNESTLGISEEEIVFHVSHVAEDIVAREEAARATLQAQDSVRLEDRVARALGLARRARLLEYSEALALLSSIRLGVVTGLVKHSLWDVHDLLVAAQSAHIRVRAGQTCDQLALNTRRADLFRERFSSN